MMLKMKDLIKEFATVGGVVTTKPEHSTTY